MPSKQIRMASPVAEGLTERLGMLLVRESAGSRQALPPGRARAAVLAGLEVCYAGLRVQT